MALKFFFTPSTVTQYKLEVDFPGYQRPLLMDAASISKLLTAIASNISSMTSGTDASTVVAINCIGGRSFGQYLVYIATFDFGSRYQGMKLAFGEDTEIFKVVGDRPPQQLTTDDYDKFVRTALEVHEARAATTSPQSSHCPTRNFFLREHSNFPVIRWGRTKYPFIIALLYTFISLCSMSIALLLRFLLDKTPFVFEATYMGAFLIVSLYTNSLLLIRRSICYVDISKGNVSKDMLESWEKLRRLAVPVPRDAKEAVWSAREGLVSVVAEEGTTLLMPVMCISTAVEDEPASWWLLLNDLRGPLMAAGLWSTRLGDARIDWGMVYGIVGYFEARLQRAVAERYLRDAKTRDVFWFRRYAAQKDYAVVPEHRFELQSPRKSPLSSVAIGSPWYSLSWMGYEGFRAPAERRLIC